jgi:DNA-binding LacI/PurR family transcriptional regulator
MSSIDSNLQPIKSKQKLAQVKTAIRQLAEKHPPGTKLPTVRELCKQLNVAIATLDAALSELETIGVISRRRGSGIFVCQNISQKTVGVIFGLNIFDAGTSPVFRQILDHCQQRAETHNERFSFYIDIDQWDDKIEGYPPFPAHSNLARDLISSKLHGAFLLWPRDAEEVNWVREHKLPVVSLECEGAEKNGDLRLDYNELQKLGIEALLKQGCRRIGLIQNIPDFPAMNELLAPYQAVCRSEWVWRPSRNIIQLDATNEEIGYQVARRMLGSALASKPDRESIPDGLVIMDDMITRGALTALRKLGLSPGKDIHIATHANKGSNTLYGNEEDLTLIEFAPKEIVETLFQMLEFCWERNRLAPPSQSIKPVVRLPAPTQELRDLI